jgi:tetratricopeptide (TPR) repeat protein
VGLATEARALATGDVAAEAEADRILGLLARDDGDLDGARSLLERSLAAASGLPDPAASIAATNALALVVAEQGDLDLAITLAESARFSARRAGERHLEAAVENNLADMLRAAGRDDEAMEHLRAAVVAFADVGEGAEELEPGIWMLETW